MKRISGNAVVFAAGILLASCTPPEIEIAVSRMDGRQLVSLTQDWGLIFGRDKTPCVGMIELRTDTGMDSSAWRLELKDGQCVDLDGFTIGQVPAGFVETVPLAAGSRGTFRLIVMGIGVGETRISLP